jgi:hydrogenase maturation protease
VIRIIGIGSPFGDDAAGLEVARIIAKSPPPNCEVIIADRPGADLIEMLGRVEAVILIDAVRSGAPAGTIHQLSFNELARSKAQFVSSHELGVAAAVQLAYILGRAPRRGIVLGIEIATPAVQVPCSITQHVRQAIGDTLSLVPSLANELRRCRAS